MNETGLAEYDIREDDMEQRRDLEEKQREAEEAFQRIYLEFASAYPVVRIHHAQSRDWAIIAREMSCTKLYLKLKDGK